MAFLLLYYGLEGKLDILDQSLSPYSFIIRRNSETAELQEYMPYP